MAALVNPSSSAIICSDVPAKLCRVNKSIAASISRVRVSVVPSAAVVIASSLIGPIQLYDRKVQYFPFVKLTPLQSTRSKGVSDERDRIEGLLPGAPRGAPGTGCAVASRRTKRSVGGWPTAARDGGPRYS